VVLFGRYQRRIIGWTVSANAATVVATPRTVYHQRRTLSDIGPSKLCSVAGGCATERLGHRTNAP
jgi:hypothetical protein